MSTLLRAFLRRDRWTILAWTVGITLLYYSQAVSVDGLYQTQAEFDRAAASMESNAAFIAMAGPARALNTVGGQVAWQAMAFGAVCAALMSMFLIGRHTRAEEESGREELLRAAAVSRTATSTAAVLTALIANAVVGGAVALSLISYPLALADSLALGAGVMVVGWAFTGVALIAAQLTSTTRATYAVTGAVIAVAYLLRMVGDVGAGWLSWLSPIGIYQQMHPFSGVRWWPVLLLLVLALLTLVVGYRLHASRDYGGGLLAARPGPARATASLVGDRPSGLGLAWRLQRGQVIGWTIGLFVGGLSFGSMGTDVGSMLGDGDAAAALTGGAADLTQGFYSFLMVMLAIIAAGFAIGSELRPHAEEDAGRVELLLATGLSRSRWLAAQVLVTVVGSVLVVAAAGLGLSAGLAWISHLDGAWGYSLDMLGYVAPVLVLAGLARLCHGLWPQYAGVAWAGLGVSFVIMMFGELLRFPQWLVDVSPFSHLALVPAEPFRWLPLLLLLITAAVLSGVGQVAFARRDLR